MAGAWDQLGTVEPKALTEARLQAHHAIQWATRLARANLAPMPDDRQTNLGWDRADRALLSHDCAGGKSDALRVGLRVETMTLIVQRGSAITDQFPLDGHTHAEAGAWLDQIAGAAGLALPGGATLPYAIPMHPVGDGAPYACAARRGEFAVLAAWFDSADEILTAMRSSLPAGAASPVRCWPHHFDIATLWTLGEGDAETAPSVGIGMCPGDNYYPQPYFYVSPWPPPAPKKLPALSSPGGWHTCGFVGAVLSGDTIVPMPDRRGGVRRFLDTASDIASRLTAAR